ncbi:hypothetical protein [Undibacterium sp. Ji22W]|uniref:hypothetical protein n=1 Tax=Undibacterium sp. Ji22W TaxID=3413038 RepID=UPI003BF2C06B
MYKKRRSGGLTRVSFQSSSEGMAARNSSSDKRSAKADILQHQALLQALLKNTSSKHTCHTRY